MSEVLMELKNVGLSYRTPKGLFSFFKFNALSNISFSLHKGETLGILGLNGSGKSSLLKVMAGILEPDTGKIISDSNLTKSLLSLGLGFKASLSGRDNALLSCMLNGLSKSDAKKKVDDIKEFSGLGDFFEQPVRSYSSGMRSKLGFSAGIILDVDILLIDEVLSVGDHTFRKKAEKALLSKINSNQTVVFVSHSKSQINRLCSRCVWLEKGKVRMIGSTSEVDSLYEKDE